MMKKYITFVLVLACVLCLTLPAFAAELPPVADDADLFTEAEEALLTEELKTVRQAWSIDVVIVTADDLGGLSSTEYADNFFDSNGYGCGPYYDGILFLIDMENRLCTTSTSGTAIGIFTDAGQDYILDEVAYWLTDGDYYTAAETFIRFCDDYCRQAQEGEPYDVGNLPETKFPFFLILIISLVIGFIVALIVTAVMRGQLKSVHAKAAAADYVKAGSLQVTESRDLFLYRNVTRREKPKQTSGGSSTHTAASGRTHGGRSRGF